MKPNALLFSLIIVCILSACNGGTGSTTTTSDSTVTTEHSSIAATGITEENVTISADTTNMQCFVAYDNSKTDKRPIVLIVPEWWGLNDYPKMRARQLAELGYFALAVDLYGNGAVGATPDQAKALAGGFYANPQLATSRIQAALAKAKTYAQADSSKTAAIGYCFGGSMVLNAAKLGAPLDAVVSFHGGLAGVTPSKNTIKGKILVCHGLADKFVSPQEVATFKKQMDSVGAKYTFIGYPNATHAFTNPGADENAAKFKMPIAYNPEADKKSWNDMKDFFASVWK
jgi:dienelactone hydrolase